MFLLQTSKVCFEFWYDIRQLRRSSGPFAADYINIYCAKTGFRIDAAYIII